MEMRQNKNLPQWPGLLLRLLLLLVLVTGCSDVDAGPAAPRNYRTDMREFVRGISAYAKGIRSDFLIITQNGNPLLTDNGKGAGSPSHKYIKAIDGVGQESLFYGYNADNEPTPGPVSKSLLGLLETARNHGLRVLVTDYCWEASYAADSYARNAKRKFISFAADRRELDNIPEYPPKPYSANFRSIRALGEAKNFLYIINPDGAETKWEFMRSLRGNDYDLVIMDAFFQRDDPFTSKDVSLIRQKARRGKRLVIAYMSIGEAEDYRYYWRRGWAKTNPPWLEKENPDWPGNHKVRYWDPAWQKIIFGNEDSYLKKIIDAGFDGVYLDIIDAFEYFEGQHPS